MTERVQQAIKTIEYLMKTPESRILIELYGLRLAFPKACKEWEEALTEEYLINSGIFEWEYDELY